MRTSRELTRLVCAAHCRFYRAGEKLEESCRGYDYLAERVARGPGQGVRDALLKLAEARAQTAARDPGLEARLCAECGYRENDCDFMSGEDLPEAAPCGGYVAVALLLAEFPAAARELFDGE